MRPLEVWCFKTNAMQKLKIVEVLDERRCSARLWRDRGWSRAIYVFDRERLQPYANNNSEGQT